MSSTGLHNGVNCNTILEEGKRRQNDRDRKKEKEEEDRMKEKMQRMCTQRSVLHKNCKASAQQLSKAELNPPLLLQSLATMEGCKWTYK